MAFVERKGATCCKGQSHLKVYTVYIPPAFLKNGVLIVSAPLPLSRCKYGSLKYTVSSIVVKNYILPVYLMGMLMSQPVSAWMSQEVSTWLGHEL